jgi:hypothetical protein
MQKLPDVLLQYKIFPRLTVLELILLFLTNKRFTKLLKPIIESHPDFYYKAVWQGPKLNRWYLNNPFILPDSLQYCFMEEADLSRANLTYAIIIIADLSRANLTKANLTGANLTDAILIGANLRGANLIGADLTKANLTGANLTDAILIGANLRGADLTNTNLTGAIMPVGWSLILRKD